MSADWKYEMHRHVQTVWDARAVEAGLSIRRPPEGVDFLPGSDAEQRERIAALVIGELGASFEAIWSGRCAEILERELPSVAKMRETHPDGYSPSGREVAS